MRAILPRRQTCVMCGNPIEDRGRIDRLYCKAKCRNLAWRFRAGKRAGKPPASVPLAAARRRGGLLRQAWGLQGEVAATRRRIDDLLAERAQAQARATTERQCLDEARAALDQERGAWNAERERLQAELAVTQEQSGQAVAAVRAVLDQERAAWNAERMSLQAKLALAHEQAARDEATMQAVNTAHTTLLQYQTAWAGERTRLRAELAAVRKQSDAQEAKLQEEVQRLARPNRELDERMLEAEPAQGQTEDWPAITERIQEVPADQLAELQGPLRQSKPQDQPSEEMAPPANGAMQPTLPPASHTPLPALAASPPPADLPPTPVVETDTPSPQQAQPRPVGRLRSLLRKLVEPPDRKGRHLLD